MKHPPNTPGLFFGAMNRHLLAQICFHEPGKVNTIPPEGEDTHQPISKTRLGCSGRRRSPGRATRAQRARGSVDLDVSEAACPAAKLQLKGESCEMRCFSPLRLDSQNALSKKPTCLFNSPCFQKGSKMFQKIPVFDVDAC